MASTNLIEQMALETRAKIPPAKALKDRKILTFAAFKLLSKEEQIKKAPRTSAILRARVKDNREKLRKALAKLKALREKKKKLEEKRDKKPSQDTI